MTWELLSAAMGLAGAIAGFGFIIAAARATLQDRRIDAIHWLAWALLATTGLS